jgi:RND family efflux transporter MFP subunit
MVSMSPSQRTRLKFELPVLVLCLAGLAADRMIKHRKPPEDRPPVVIPLLVRTADAHESDVRITVRSHGTVVPRARGHLAPEISGRVAEVSPALENGGFFEEGEVLARIDPQDYELAVVRARAQVAQAEARLQREEAEAAVARREWERLGEGKPTDLVLREPQLAEARAALASARAILLQSERDLERTEIRAPYAGRILEKLVDVGDFVNRGAPLARIYATDYGEVRIPVPDDQIAFVDLPLDPRGSSEKPPGPPVTLRTRFAGEDLEWRGTIVRTEGEIDPKSRMVTAVARIEDPYGRTRKTVGPPLAVGLFVEAEIAGETARGVVEIPRSALRGRDTVWVVEDGRLRFREVEVLRAGIETALIRSGLEEGDRICLSSIEAATEGMRVRLEGNETP